MSQTSQERNLDKRFMVCVTDGVASCPRCPVADVEVLGSCPSRTMLLDYFEQLGFQVVPYVPRFIPMMAISKGLTSQQQKAPRKQNTEWVDLKLEVLGSVASSALCVMKLWSRSRPARGLNPETLTLPKVWALSAEVETQRDSFPCGEDQGKVSHVLTKADWSHTSNGATGEKIELEVYGVSGG
jgi:hypothetical protein